MDVETRSLALWIESCSCKCGQRWTNSYLTYSNGGTPTPLDEDKLSPMIIYPTQKNYSWCFRCAPLGLNIGWSRPEAESPACGASTSASLREAEGPSAKDLLS